MRGQSDECNKAFINIKQKHNYEYKDVLRLLKEQQLLEKQMADMAERMAEITEELNNLKQENWLLFK